MRDQGTRQDGDDREYRLQVAASLRAQALKLLADADSLERSVVEEMRRDLTNARARIEELEAQRAR